MREKNLSMHVASVNSSHSQASICAYKCTPPILKGPSKKNKARRTSKGIAKMYFIKRSLLICLTLLLMLICGLARNNTLSETETDSDNKGVLSILATGPYPDPLDNGWHGGKSLTGAVRLALHQINQRPDILNDYRLEAIEDNSGCEVTATSLVSFFRSALYSGKNIVGLIGPACSGPAVTLAPLLSRNGISLIQIAPTATSPRLQDEHHNTTFTIIRSASRVIDAFIALMLHNGWSRVATLYDVDRDTFSAINFKLIEQVNKYEQLDVVYTSHVLDESDQSFFPLDRISTKQVRLIFLLTKAETALKILCLAFHMGMTYPTYQWIITAETRIELTDGNYVVQHTGKEYQCSKLDLLNALNGLVFFSYQLRIEDDATLSITNQTYKEYREIYTSELTHNTTLETLQLHNDWKNTYYDATWALAFALDKASQKGLNLTQYTFGHPLTTDLIANELRKVRFMGATGLVTFEVHQKSKIIISQLWATNSLLEKVAVGYSTENELVISNESESSFIPNSFMKVPVYIHLGAGITIIVLAVILSIFTATLHIAFIVWRKKRSIKATSPAINHLIFSGCYLFALAAILYPLQQTTSLGLDPTTHAIVYSVFCNVITWFLLTGYTLIFGSVFMKIWRVYRLFKHFSNQRPSCLKDKVLMVLVVILLLVDVMYCSVWSAHDPWVKLETEISQQPIGSQVLVRVSCSCTNATYWIAIIAAYKGALLILLVVFSTLNRKIQREHFRHTKKINVLVYSLTVIYGIGFPLYFLLVDVQMYVSFITLSTILLSTILFCCLMLFITPVYHVIKPKRQKILQTEATVFFM